MGGGGGEGGLFERGACFILWPKGLALIRGRVLIRALALARGNTVRLLLCLSKQYHAASVHEFQLNSELPKSKYKGKRTISHYKTLNM